MDKVEKFIRQYAMYSPTEYKEADLDDFLSNFEIEQRYMGQLSRVHRIVGEDWMIKEARWDFSMELFGDVQVPFPIKMTEKVMNTFKFYFLPKKKQIINEYRLYLEFAQYFGYFEKEDDYYHPNRDMMFVAQQNIRKSLKFFKPEMEEYYNFKFDSRIDEVLDDEEITKHNFLPKEYQLVGRSISPENEGKITSLIFQEFIDGEILREHKDDELEMKYRKQLILLMYLILLMRMQIGFLPDTRPKYHVFEAYNWVTKTENIMVSKKRGLVFIDTRWFWDTSANYIRQGLIIPKLMETKSKESINHLLKGL